MEVWMSRAAGPGKRPQAGCIFPFFNNLMPLPERRAAPWHSTCFS